MGGARTLFMCVAGGVDWHVQYCPSFGLSAILRVARRPLYTKGGLACFTLVAIGRSWQCHRAQISENRAQNTENRAQNNENTAQNNENCQEGRLTGRKAPTTPRDTAIQHHLCNRTGKCCSVHFLHPLQILPFSFHLFLLLLLQKSHYRFLYQIQLVPQYYLLLFLLFF